MIKSVKWEHFSPKGLGEKAAAMCAARWARRAWLPKLLVLNPAMRGKQSSFN